MTAYETAQQCCEPCWERRNPGREPFRRDPVEHEACLFCGNLTASGIYLRPLPGEMQRYARRMAQAAQKAASERATAPVSEGGTEPAPRSEAEPSDDRALVRAITTSRPKAQYGQCEFCGYPCQGRACAEHKDLLLAVEGAVA